MGLDMYLNRRTMFYDVFGSNDERDKFELGLNIEPERVNCVIETIIYWRKSNHVHNWFVNNVQNGNDDCGIYIVNESNICALFDIVNKIIKEKETKGEEVAKVLAMKLLPPKEGFFFGSTEIDHNYWQDLDYTSNALDGLLTEMRSVLPGGNYHQHYTYGSSW
jgi:hypothetical protein